MKREIAWIQALRGVAALMVVVCHARIVLRGTPWEAFAEHWFTPGALGVDLFFMISGFIMFHTTLESDGSLRYTLRFLVKRFSRIWPVYIAAMFIDLSLSAQHIHDVLSSREKINSYLASMIFFPSDGAKPPFFGTPYGVGWTLNFEIYFYLIFGLSMLFGRARWMALATWFACTLIAIPTFLTGHPTLSIQENYGLNGYWTLATNPIIWEFAVGLLLGYIYHSKLSLPRSFMTYLALVASVCFALWYDFTWHGSFNGLSEWGAPLPLMLLIITLASKNCEILVPRPLVWIGGISFSLYLFHPIASDILKILLINVGLAALVHTWWCVGLIIVFSNILAWLAYRLLEQGVSNSVRDALIPIADMYSPRKQRIE